MWTILKGSIGEIRSRRSFAQSFSCSLLDESLLTEIWTNNHIVDLTKKKIIIPVYLPACFGPLFVFFLWFILCFVLWSRRESVAYGLFQRDQSKRVWRLGGLFRWERRLRERRERGVLVLNIQNMKSHHINI